MYICRAICILFVCSFIALASRAQVDGRPNTLSNLRSRTIVHKATPVVLDTVSIIPGSFFIKDLDSTYYELDYINATLNWLKPVDTGNYIATYRVFGIKLNPVLQRMNFDSLVLNSAAPIPARNDQAGDNRALFNFGNINAQGSFGRQVGFGNNQDLVLNSSLNVQLSGMLADSIELQAAIADNNIPIQPDGNTQHLNEFDEVYIRFKKRNWQLNLGDMDIRESKNYFLKFYKRLQGISFQTENQLSRNTSANTFVSGSIAKGKFTRNVFQGLEGNQGPYRLTGASDELFFIILANTERVFIDGVLLQRGEDQDYVINYNTAEITFTPRQMITKDSRIQVEFEYADRNYLNTNIYGTEELNVNNRLKFRIGFFNNSDAKNSSINQVLDAKQKQFLSAIGDSIQYALYPSAVPDTFSAGKILYEKIYIDTLAVIDSFYQYSTDASKELYNVSFTQVGIGNGNYVLDNSNANGKVFKYVAPSGGVKQGDYEAVMALITPKKQQVLSLGVDYAINQNTMLRTEVAGSNYDVNTFSRLGAGDDKGYAAKVNLENKKLLRQKDKLQLVSTLDYEYVQKRFQPVERLREVEFSRDWGLELQTERATESIAKAAFSLQNQTGNRLAYTFTNYHRDDKYNGFQHSLAQYANWNNWVFNNDITITSYSGDINKGHFFRPVLDLSRKFPALNNWSAGLRYTLEDNTSRNTLTDTLNPTAFYFDTYTFFIRSDEAKRNKFGINFYTRSDKYPFGKRFVRGDRSYNLNVNTSLLANEKRQLAINATYRKLKVYNPAVSNQQEDNTLLSRIEYNMNEWKGFLSGNILYEVGSGQEQKREFAYLEVPAGTGEYTWIDYNEDGVQQLNEFEVAAFPDQAKFIRVYTPANEYMKANYTTLNYSLSLNPKLLWERSPISGFRKMIARFNLASSMQVSRKAQSEGLVDLNPFNYGLIDTNLITMSSMLVNTLSFNRYSSVWGLDISKVNNTSKSLLTYGYESRKNNEWSAKLRYFLSGAFTINFNGTTGVSALYSDNNQFENRNYEINRFSITPMISYISGTTFRVAGSYKLESKENNQLYGGEKSVSNSITLETKYNILQSSAVTASFTFDNLTYTSETDHATTVSYIMLNGLLPGKNLLWNVVLTKRLLKNLELNFQYDGRKPAGSKTIHTGRASLTALF